MNLFDYDFQNEYGTVNARPIDPLSIGFLLEVSDGSPRGSLVVESQTLIVTFDSFALSLSLSLSPPHPPCIRANVGLASLSLSLSLRGGFLYVYCRFCHWCLILQGTHGGIQ